MPDSYTGNAENAEDAAAAALAAAWPQTFGADPVHCDQVAAVAVRAALAALAGAGRLLPEDTRTEWSFAYPDGVADGQNFTEDGARRYAEDFNGTVVRRWVGPWVPAPTPVPPAGLSEEKP